MPGHAHLIFGARDGNPANLLGRFKEFTAKKIIQSIRENSQESRREWMLQMFESTGSKAAMWTDISFGSTITSPLSCGEMKLLPKKRTICIEILWRPDLLRKRIIGSTVRQLIIVVERDQ